MVTDRRSEFEATLTRTAEARGQEAGAALQRASLLRDAIHRFIRNRAAVVAAVAFVVMVGFVILTPWLSHGSAYGVDFAQAYKYPRWAHPFGAGWYRVLFRHLLPNTLGVILIFVFLELPGVVLGEAFLSFIGLGISPPKASWGTLAQDGYSAYEAHPYIIIIPSLAIAWLILSAFFVADGLRDALDPRTRET